MFFRVRLSWKVPRWRLIPLPFPLPSRSVSHDKAHSTLLNVGLSSLWAFTNWAKSQAWGEPHPLASANVWHRSTRKFPLSGYLPSALPFLATRSIWSSPYSFLALDYSLGSTLMVPTAFYHIVYSIYVHLHLISFTHQTLSSRGPRSMIDHYIPITATKLDLE